MGILKSVFNYLYKEAQKVDEQSKRYYDKYRWFEPQKLLKEMDNCGSDIAKKMALKKLYTEKADTMAPNALQKITKDAKKHCSSDVYNFAQNICQEVINRRAPRDPWK